MTLGLNHPVEEAPRKRISRGLEIGGLEAKKQTILLIQGDSTQESQPSPYLFSSHMEQSQNPLAW